MSFIDKHEQMRRRPSINPLSNNCSIKLAFSLPLSLPMALRVYVCICLNMCLSFCLQDSNQMNISMLVLYEPINSACLFHSCLFSLHFELPAYSYIYIYYNRTAVLTEKHYIYEPFNSPRTITAAPPPWFTASGLGNLSVYTLTETRTSPLTRCNALE